MVLVRNLSYTPDASFSSVRSYTPDTGFIEKIHFHSSCFVVLVSRVSLTLLMLALVRSFFYTFAAGFSGGFVFLFSTPEASSGNRFI